MSQLVLVCRVTRVVPTPTASAPPAASSAYHCSVAELNLNARRIQVRLCLCEGHRLHRCHVSRLGSAGPCSRCMSKRALALPTGIVVEGCCTALTPAVLGIIIGLVVLVAVAIRRRVMKW